ncbi:SDR family NAD(P)-dependent oxidoreductase [Xanthobacter oligotrophicus]|uniref:SDR family NAD(P)-dependent oxidoreductase n=1 Tax=Xanthobacter oligotrophicus TaxID=2607286 RepID=UPI0011F309C6|nr:SDR family NAD(P)-dependent oxidoreductase [Xanthobacter oligotrophicus]MCG5237800.1 SDR family NAD(P)-dependent oxidoreductase [Xanthobacter oligotrophicus]
MSIARDDGPAGAGTGLSAAQKRALLARLMAEGKGRAVARAEGFVALFERQAGLTPDAPAVSDGSDGLTYSELNARATEWEQALRACGARPGNGVGLALARGPALVAGLIGILKAGCAFLPLEPEDAPARLDRLRASARFVLTQEGGTEASLVEASLAAEGLAAGDLAKAGTASADTSAFALIAPERALLAVPERAVAERLAWLRQAFRLGAGDVSLCAASLHDISAVTSLFWPLTVGAKVALAPVEREPAALAALAHATGATCALLPAAALPLLDETALRLLFLDGDPPPGIAGPAGADTFTLWQVAEAGGPVLAQPVGEGAPLTGAPLRILDRHGQPVPLGGVGNLAVTPAPGLPEVMPGARARQRADGRFERRLDGGRRVEAGGLRFSLAAIEAELRGQAGIAECRVLERVDTAGAPRLVAYIAPQGHATPEAWAPYSASVLPLWQRPAAFVAVAALPLTEAGAVDDAALARLPVPDAFAAALWRQRLEHMDGIAEAAVVVHTLAPEPAFVTLPPVALLPPSATALPESPPAPEGPWALADGGPLDLPADAPRTLTDALLRTAERAGDKGILFHGSGPSRQLTYVALFEEARRIAGGLRAAGLEPGDTAILQVPDLRAHLPTFWGCVLAGVQPVTVAVSATFAERTALVAKLINAWELLGRPVVLAPAALAAPLAGLARFADAAPHVLALEQLTDHAPLETVHAGAPEDVLFLQLSSGSTGTPKCIQITHGGVVAHIHATVRVNGYGADDVALNWLPMDHVVPMLTWHLRDVYLGCAQIQVETAAVLTDPLLWLDLMDRHRVTRSWSPNFGFKLVSDALRQDPGRRFALGHVRTLMNAGEQATLPVIAEFLALAAPFGIRPEVMQPAFGMAEACTCMTYETGFDPARSVHWIHKGSLGGRLRPVAADVPEAVSFIRLGPPVPGVAIRIVDSAGALVPEGVIGRFQIKGGVITPGYLRNAAANAEAFVGDGWFNSGDLGFIRDGNLALTGREKELIIVNGANFYCYEIEDLVNAVDGVQPTFAAACAVPDAATGSEALALFFSPRPEADAPAVADAIRAAVTGRLGIAPAHVTAIPQPDFPKTTSGKIQRMQLRAGLMAQLAQGAGARTVPAWFHAEAWVRRELDAEPAPPRGVVLLGGPDALAAALVQALEREGVPVVSAGAEACGAVPAALGEAGAEHGARADMVVDLRPLVPAPAGETLDAFRTRAGSELAATFALLQQMGREGRPVTLTLVTRGGAGSGEGIDPARAALRGLLRTAAQEMPGLSCRQIDVGGLDAAPDLMARLAPEIRAPDGEAEVALRPAGRFVPRLEAVDPSRSPRDPALRLKTGGRYLVTGGTGGIGRALVKHLAARCRAKLLVVGRSAAGGERDSPDLLTRAVDVTDADALEAAVVEAEARFGGPLDGAFHLAGIAPAGALAQETAEGLAAAFAPKAVGARVVVEAMGRRPGGFVVLWSSVNAIFGGAEAGAYAAANAALAGMAGEGTRVLCLHWSRWQDLGMSAPAGGDSGAAEFAAARGFRTLPVEDALASFEAALALGTSPLSIGLDGASPFVRPRVRQPVRPLHGLAGFVVPRPGAVPTAPANDDVADRFGTPIPCPLRVLDALPRSADGTLDTEALSRHDGTALAVEGGQDGVEAQLATIWSALLKRPAIAPDDNFFTSGGHSLVAAGLVHRVREAFGMDLPLRILFEAPTLRGMARWIAANASAEADRRPLPDCLVPVQPEGGRPPLFCVHPAGGSPWCYLFLADHLGRDQPLYGFQAPGLIDDTPPLSTVEEMARLYVEAMRLRQPAGPYHVAAWSSGGPVVFEMARLLEEGGECVATLAFLDCAVMETENFVRSRDPLRHVKALWRMGTFVTQVRLPRSYGDLAALARLIGLSLPASFRDLRLDRAFWTGVGRSLRIFNLNTTMGYRYCPSRIAAGAVLFRAGSSQGADDPLEAELRTHVAGGVVRVDLPGNHMSIILDPEGAAALAARLKPFLDGEAGARKGEGV